MGYGAWVGGEGGGKNSEKEQSTGNHEAKINGHHCDLGYNLRLIYLMPFTAAIVSGHDQHLHSVKSCLQNSRPIKSGNYVHTYIDSAMIAIEYS